MKQRTLRKQSSRNFERLRAEERARNDSHLRCQFTEERQNDVVFRPKADLRKKPPWVFKFWGNCCDYISSRRGTKNVEIDCE